MFKASILNYHTSLKNSIRSSAPTLWILVSGIIPVAVFISFLVYRDAVASLVMSLYPPSYRQGVAFYTDLVALAGSEVIWIGLFLMVCICLVAYPSKERLLNATMVRSRVRGLYWMMLAVSFSFFASVWIAGTVLERFPNSSDEYAYLFQAEMFSRGKWWERAHALPDFFYINNIPQLDGILVSRFPPGWPLLLSFAFEIGMQPSLVNPIMGLLTLLLIYMFAERYYGKRVAVWSVLILSFSGFYLFNSASFFSHSSCLFFTTLFVFSVYRYKDTRNFSFGLLAGFALGSVVLIRYYTAVLIFIPFFIYLITYYRMGVFPLFFWMALGSLPCLVFLSWYNYSITGNPMLPVTMWAYPDEKIGFVKGHTALKGLEHLLRRTLMFIYWTSPGLLVLYVVFLWKKIKNTSERFLKPEDYFFASLTIGYFFYYQIGGNQYGPRFMFEAFPFMVLFVVNKVFESEAKWAVALLLVCTVYPLVKLPFIADREARIVDQRQDLYDLVEARKISHAVVFVSAPTSPLRPMPAEDLTRNDPKFMNDVIYVLALPRINHEIMDYYSDRSFYRYVRDLDNPHGELIRIR